MYNPLLFADRAQAGRKLASRLKELELPRPVVLAIPAGGVPVGVEIAKALACPLGLVIVRKIQFPWTTEAGFGAVAADGTIYLGPAARELSPDAIRIQTQKAVEQVVKRQERFLGGREEVEVKGKTAILVDDGLAAGSTMLVAVRSVKRREPARVMVAAPVASGGAVALLEKEADEVVVLYRHPEGLPFAVASSYAEWHDLSDEEVIGYLEEMGG